MTPLAWTPGEQTEVPVAVVYAVVTGSALLIVLGTGLVAWWLHRRARRRDAGLARTPKPRRARRLTAKTRPAVERNDIVGAAIPRPVQVAAAVPSGSITPGVTGFGMPTQRAARPVDPRWASDASGEYALLRAASARAQRVANEARYASIDAAGTLDTAERLYEEARRAYAESLAATPHPVPTTGSADDREVARAALDAYRRGELTAEELRRVWYSTSGWDARHDEAERLTREFRTAEINARQRYHLALARARAARQAEYVADTAARALGAETVAAATELAAEQDSQVRPRRRWPRVRPRTAAPAATPPVPASR